MVRDYELMYIVRPELDEDALRAAVEQVQSLVEGQGGEVTRTTQWGKRRLAYEVDKLRDGHYVILDLRLDGDRVTEVDRALEISDTVFRHLMVQVDMDRRRRHGEAAPPAAAGAAAAASNGAGAPGAIASTAHDVGEDTLTDGDEDDAVDVAADAEIGEES